MPVRLGLFALLIAAVVALVPVPASAATNLGALWHLDESSGTTALDSSGNANHGTLDGDPARVAGRFQHSLRFDGVDDNVLIARSDSLEPQAVTIEGWVRADAGPGPFRYIISQGGYLCEVASYGLYTASGGGVGFYVSNGSDDQLAVSPQAPPEAVWDGAWHHVAGTYDGSALRLFVDGSEVGSGTAANMPIGYGLPNPAGLIGAFGGTCSLNWAGDLDTPRIWRRAMAPAEVAASAAMGAPATQQISQRIDASQAIVYTSQFSAGDITISTQSSTGAEKITSVKLVALRPVTSGVTCSGGVLAVVNSSCDFSPSNDGRTARVVVRPLRGEPQVTLRVTVTSGRTFDVLVDASGTNTGIQVEARAEGEVRASGKGSAGKGG